MEVELLAKKILKITDIQQKTKEQENGENIEYQEFIELCSSNNGRGLRNYVVDKVNLLKKLYDEDWLSLKKEISFNEKLISSVSYGKSSELAIQMVLRNLRNVNWQYRNTRYELEKFIKRIPKSEKMLLLRFLTVLTCDGINYNSSIKSKYEKIYKEEITISAVEGLITLAKKCKFIKIFQTDRYEVNITQNGKRFLEENTLTPWVGYN